MNVINLSLLLPTTLQTQNHHASSGDTTALHIAGSASVNWSDQLQIKHIFQRCTADMYYIVRSVMVASVPNMRRNFFLSLFCKTVWGATPKPEYIYKNCVFILTCLNFGQLQSTLHLMQYTYWDIFFPLLKSLQTH